MDYSELKGGLTRMLDRLQAEGTATKNPEADAFLCANGNAAVIGLLLDQRVLAETAFTGPLKLKERLGHFDMKTIAEQDAIRRLKKSVSRVQELFAGDEEEAMHG